MTLVYPTATPAQGNTKVQVCPAVPILTAPNLSADINAAGSLDISCFVRDWNPEITNNQGSAPVRLCTTVQLPEEGNTQFSPIELRYVYDPQAGATDDNKAKDLLVRGTILYAVVRKGLDAQATDWAAGQMVEVWKFRCGRQNHLKSGDDEFAEYEIKQLIFPLLDPTYDVAIVA